MENLGTSIEQALGQEFLTWLWYRSEKQNGTFYKISDKSPYVLYVHQRVVVRGGEENAVETASVSGIHSALREAKMGLTTGKLVVRALIRMERNEMDWQVTLKADDFSINGLKTVAVSKEDKDDNPDAIFLEKMFLIEEGLLLLDDIYHQFLEVRINEQEWNDEIKRIAEWINTEV